MVFTGRPLTRELPMVILNEEVIYQDGCFRHVRRWIKGWVEIPGGKYVMGITGKETVVELRVVTSAKTFQVMESKTSP